VRSVRCEHRDRKHGEQDEQAVREVVRVEPVRVEREPGPGPDDGDEERDVLQESVERGLARQVLPQLGHRHNEDEVEKELEPRRVALLEALLDRPQPGRIEEAREIGH
jgi:hypothetical protein